jgi:hypothetical protein
MLFSDGHLTNERFGSMNIVFDSIFYSRSYLALSIVPDAEQLNIPHNNFFSSPLNFMAFSNLDILVLSCLALMIQWIVTFL